MSQRLIPALLALALAGPALAQSPPPSDASLPAVAADTVSEEKVIVVPGRLVNIVV